MSNTLLSEHMYSEAMSQDKENKLSKEKSTHKDASSIDALLNEHMYSGLSEKDMQKNLNKLAKEEKKGKKLGIKF